MATSFTSNCPAPVRRVRLVALSSVLLGAALAGCGPQANPPAASAQVASNVPAPASVAASPAAVPAAPAPAPAAVPTAPAVVAQAAPAVVPADQPTYTPDARQGRPVPPVAPAVHRDPPAAVTAEAATAPPPRARRQPVATNAQVRVASNRIGRISSIEPIRERPQGSGAGGVLGGVLGAVVGNQFGHGNGRAAMTVIGGVGGAVAGNNVERNVKEHVVGYRINVVLNDGASRTYEETELDGLRVGDRVRVDGNNVLRRI